MEAAEVQKERTPTIPRLSKKSKTDFVVGTSVVKPIEQVAVVGDLASAII